jgi:hypothetical protein
MAQKEAEQLNDIMWGAALSRAVSSVAKFGVAGMMRPGLAGSPQV